MLNKQLGAVRRAFAPLAFAALSVCGLASTSSAAVISLDLIDSYSKDGAFGLAFDGTNIWWSQNNGDLHEMSTVGVDTGRTISTGVWSELAWDGSKILQAQGSTVFYWNTDGTSAGTAAINSDAINGGRGCGGLVDGLDYDHGELWCSPDVSDIYRMSGDLQTAIGAQPLGGGFNSLGGYSGVERIQATNGTNYIVVVNDATNPRKLCVHAMDYSEIGCQQFANARYEGLAFDGRYVYAADYFGNKIDKYDILGGGISIIDPVSPVPLPASGLLLLAGVTILAARRRKSRRA